jgi:argininosuccinate synthase
MEAVEARGLEACLLLYSGGLDGTHFLDWALSRGIEVLALNVGLEGRGKHERSARLAAALGAEYVFRDRTEEFVSDYVAAGIRANAYYRGLFPLCSSFSRPLMARAAVGLARERGIGAIAHTSTPTQNTAGRFTLSLMALAPEIAIIAPYLRTRLTREQKLGRLVDKGMDFDGGIYSVDQNLWGRVIECGSLENPENDLPDAGIFRWSADVLEASDEPEVVELAFEEGLPTRLNGEELALKDIVMALNRTGGAHGIGRFAGLEDTALAVKNHEVREAPAAQILTTAHRELESAVLTQEESNLKAFLDDRWTNLIASGHWYSDLAEALAAFSRRMNEVVNGWVRLKLHKGNLKVLSKGAPAGLYYAGFEEDFYALVGELSIPPTYAFMGLPYVRRLHARTGGAR